MINKVLSKKLKKIAEMVKRELQIILILTRALVSNST